MLKSLSCSCYPQLVQNVHSKIKMLVYTMSVFPSNNICCTFYLNLSTYLYFAVTRQQKIAKIISQTPMPVDMEQPADDMKQTVGEQPVDNIEHCMCEEPADDVEQPAGEVEQPVCEQPADEVEQPRSE